LAGLRFYNDLTAPDRSGIVAQVEAQRERVKRRFADVARTLAVMSGKGGVGKSFVTSQLATGLAARGHRVGVLDADLYGPTIPRLLHLARPPGAAEGQELAPGETADGVRVISVGYLLGRQQPLEWKEPAGDGFVWRGTLEAGALRELLADVAWGKLDVLLVDLPPGATRLTDLHELLPGLSGVLAVTIPADESLDSVHRALTVARDRKLPIVGLVENMARVACPACGHVGPLFPGEAGQALAKAFGIGLTVRLPFSPSTADLRQLTEALERKLGLG
jgi:ATP-binding protein involved in chromosome partitioning